MDTEKIRQILEIFEESSVSSMDLEVGDLKIKLKKEGVPVSKKEPDLIPKKKENTGKQIKSPLVGTFYEALKPGQKPFVEVGQKVSKGDVICIIEAMKSMNEIKSDVDGFVQEILVKDGDMVEFDQPIFVIGDTYD